MIRLCKLNWCNIIQALPGEERIWFSEMPDTCEVQLPRDCFEKIESLVWCLCLARQRYNFWGKGQGTEKEFIRSYEK